MEIHILRDGKQIGPYNEENIQALLKEGALLIDDLAWRPGDDQWQPLYSVLYPAASGGRTPSVDGARPQPPPIALAKAPRKTPEPAAEPVVVAPASHEPTPVTAKPPSGPMGDPATPRQKAFLSFMGIATSPGLTKGDAALLVNEAMENPKDTRRLQQWNTDRLRLHPDIFADEIKAKRENRAQHFFEICQSEGAEFFDKVTKAHTQVLVGYLDVRFPNWDEREDDAKYSYIFPAIAEKFPQLLKKNARGKFKYPEGPKVARELTGRSSRPATPQSSPSAAGAMFRGAFMGLVILGLLYYGWATFMGPGAKKNAPSGTVAAAPTPAPLTTPPVKVVPKVVAAPTPVNHDNEAEPVKPKKEPVVAKTETPAEMPETPNPAVPESSTPANGPAVLLVSNPFEPLAATTPIPVPVVVAVPSAPPAPAGRTTIKLTKPTVVVLKFGTSTLQPGTSLPIVSVEGQTVKARYGPDVVPIPIGNTDYNEEAPAPP